MPIIDYDTLMADDCEIKQNHDVIDNYVSKEPPDWDELRKNYIGANKDWSEFVGKLSENTCNILEETWQAQFDGNVERIKKGNNVADLQGIHGYNNTAICIGASPMLKKNGHHLRDAKREDGFILVSVGSALKYLLSIGVKPDYVCIVDASILVKEQIKGVNTKGITLIANAWCHPEVLDCWKGKIYYGYLPLSRKREVDEKNLDKLGTCTEMSALGNVFNQCVLFSYKILKCHNIILCGNELTINENEYYADGTMPERMKNKNLAYVTNIKGEVRLTYAGFYQFKLALESMLGQLKGFFINATEDGIVGVSHRYGRLPWIKQYTLEQAIRMSKEAYHKAKMKEKEYMALQVANAYKQARQLAGQFGV